MSSNAVAQGRELGRRVQGSTAYRILQRLGLVCYGLVHLILGLVALRIAAGGGEGEEASANGALRELAQQPFGGVALVVLAVGLLALSLWQLIDAALWATSSETHWKPRIRRTGQALGRTGIYLVLGISALSVVLGSSRRRPDEQTASAQLLDDPLGVAALLVVAAVTAAVAITLILRGARRKFVEDFAGDPGRAGRVLGTVGHVTKGIAYLVMAGLLLAAVLTHDPGKVGGLDAALRAINTRPYGPVLLGLVALGFLAFGLYCFVWARRPRRG